MSTGSDAKAAADRLIASNEVTFPAWKRTNAGLTAMGFARVSKPASPGTVNSDLVAARAARGQDQKRGA